MDGPLKPFLTKELFLPGPGRRMAWPWGEEYTLNPQSYTLPALPRTFLDLELSHHGPWPGGYKGFFTTNGVVGRPPRVLSVSSRI